MQNQASNTTGNITDINIDHIKYKGTAIRDRENIPQNASDITNSW